MKSTRKKNRSPTSQSTTTISSLAPQSTTITSLPDDLILVIVARVPRLYYLTLSLVSKSFRSLVASPELYKVRSLLGHTESCLYVCLQLLAHEKNSWFTLCRKPDQTLTSKRSVYVSRKKKESSGYVLARVPVPESPRAHSEGLVAVGSDIYNIGGSKELGLPLSSSVSVLDCRSHTWREAPSLPVELFWRSASVLDKKIYVAGNYGGDGHSHSPSTKNTVEVFDTETQTWDPEPIPCSEINDDYRFLYCRSIWIDGNLHVTAFGRKALAYISKEDRWDTVEPRLQYQISTSSCCKIENVVYSASQREFLWYDTEVSMWRDLKGLVGLPKLRGASCVRLADYGGKLALLWDDELPNDPFIGFETLIWCAVISLERHKSSSEIWGKVEWFDHVLTVPVHYSFVHTLAATV